MKKKEALDSLLKFLSEESKKIKKKKKKSLVATPVLRRPMGSIFYMDAGVSMSETLNEGVGQKKVPTKFDHLKWKLDQFQKHFLDDFINVPDEALREEDYKYASKRTGIPVASIKSIKNTLSDLKTPEDYAKEALRAQKELGLGGGPSQAAKEIEEDALTQMTDVRDLPEEKSGMQWSMNPRPKFRGKSMKELAYEAESEELMGGKKVKIFERELPKFMYEWVLYFIEGSEICKITESKLMNDFHSTKFDNYKFVLFSIDKGVKESGAHPYDISSNTKINETKEIENKLKEFNEIFATNFIISNQYLGSDGFLKVVIENAQVTDGKNVMNRKFLDFSVTDIDRAMQLGFYDMDTVTRCITVNDPQPIARNIIGQ